MREQKKHNNKRRFEAFVHAHQGHIRTFLRKLCKNEALADDLAQESFLRAYQKFDRLTDENAQKAWIFQIAYRIFLDYIRKETRRKNLDQLRLNTSDENVHSAPNVKMDVEQAMNGLPQPQRAAILLCLSYGFSHSEAAKALGLPLGTVKSHITRGKITLRAFLTAYERA